VRSKAIRLSPVGEVLKAKPSKIGKAISNASSKESLLGAVLTAKPSKIACYHTHISNTYEMFQIKDLFIIVEW